MGKFFILIAIATSLGACTQREQNTGTGALLGAGTGAVVGGLATGRAGGALAGAAIGGAGGAIIGSATTPDRVCYGRDEWGRSVRFAC
ncbi:glycine zipper domain-containing protein [Bosea sp. 2KB_26]|uniref:glycine zipper domain-containing protein n=1 Tax=Bosea sp. 2KB_26 TaxID=3237475 RepID=UPI003F907686